MKRFTSRNWIIFGIILFGLFWRVWAGWQLPVDFDEPVYLRAGVDYAAYISTGNLQGVINYPENSEHPPLVKLLYSIPALISGESETSPVVFYGGRAVSVVFSTILLVIISIMNPIAGLFMSLDTLVIKYTSQAYLEALPLLTSLISVLAFTRVKEWRGRWFWISAVCLGLTAAGKYSYFPVVGVLLYMAIWEKKLKWWEILLYCFVALGAFGLFDPALWRPDPGNRLLDSLIFHVQYSQSAHVKEIHYPWYQPVFWISQSIPWHPEVFFFGLDEIIFPLGVVGMYWEWKGGSEPKRRWNVVWFVFSLVVLLIYPTKWPQYAVMLVPSLCLSAGSLLQRTIKRVRELDTYWDWFKIMAINPSKGLIIVVILLIVVLVGGKVGNEIYLLFLRQGWSTITAETSLLPSNTIYDIALGNNRQIVLGTENGAAFWTPPEKNGKSGGEWQIFNEENSGLPDGRVLAIFRDREGAWWFGTQTGMANYQEGAIYSTAWHTYAESDLGVEQPNIRCIRQGSDGRIWAGTFHGLLVYDGSTWQNITTSNSGLIDDAILSLEIETGRDGDVIWVGTLTGISRLDVSTGDWITYHSDSNGIGWGGIADLMLDAEGQIWASSLGGGISIWDGKGWTPYRVSNSDIPLNTIQRMAETSEGDYWMAAAFPTEKGGVMVNLKAGQWKSFTPTNSGYTGAEPLVVLPAESGEVYIGTRDSGLVIFSTP
jgi:hypothetical protein